MVWRVELSPFGLSEGRRASALHAAICCSFTKTWKRAEPFGRSKYCTATSFHPAGPPYVNCALHDFSELGQMTAFSPDASSHGSTLITLYPVGCIDSSSV